MSVVNANYLLRCAGDPSYSSIKSVSEKKNLYQNFPGGPVAQFRGPGFDPWSGPTPVFLPGKSHGLTILVGYSPWGRKELDTTERLHFTSQGTRSHMPQLRVCMAHLKISSATDKAQHSHTPQICYILHARVSN